MKKTLIKNGRVHSGERFTEAIDILIDGERIAELGHLQDICADEVFDVAGSIICPGFIDVQNMTYQLKALDKNEGINLTSQGVTSCIIGNCGNSGILDSPDAFLRRLDYLREINLGLNVGMLVGHNSLRNFTLPKGERVATTDERNQMVRILDEALEHGAMGMSSGLMYSPGLFADEQEMIALISAVGNQSKVYATHMRDEGDQLVEAVIEALDTANKGNAKLVISHLKVTGKNNWGKSSEVIKLLDQRKQSQDIHVDFYPYSTTSTVLSIVMLPEIRQGIGGDFSKLQYNFEDEHMIEAEGKQNLCPNGWNDIVIVTTKIPDAVGWSIGSLAGGDSCYKTVVEILRQDPDTRVAFRNIASEDELYDIARLPYAMPGTDGYVYPKNSKEATHPRNYGAFSRVIHKYVLSENLFSLEEFIRKATQLPAQVYSLTKRGMLKNGYLADVVIFRPDEIRENATYEKPFLLSEGMQYVFVNGQLVLENNKPTKALPGRLLT